MNVKGMELCGMSVKSNKNIRLVLEVLYVWMPVGTQ